MAADIAPELFEKISAEFKRLYEWNPKIKSLLEKINAGTATYVEAAEYAELVGRTCSGAMLRFLGDDMLPDSKLYYNIAERTVRPMLEQSRDMVEEIAMSVQESLNKAAGLNMKATKPKLDDSRVKNIIDKVSDAEKFSDASWVLGDPVVNLSMNVVDKTVKANAEFHSKSGMKAKITRRQTSKCCDWCANLAGKYDYPDVPEDVYRRHENCRCIVTYVPEKGKAQDVWSKKEYASEREAVEARLKEREYVQTIEEKFRREKNIARENGDKYIDATEYWNNKPKDYPAYITDTPKRFVYKGIEYEQDGVHVFIDKDKSAENARIILLDKYGGIIERFPRILEIDKEHPGRKTPDFLWNGIAYDAKEIEPSSKSEACIYNAIHKKKDQAHRFVFDISNSTLPKESIINSVHDAFERKNWVEQIILIENKSVLKVFEKI